MDRHSAEKIYLNYKENGNAEKDLAEALAVLAESAYEEKRYEDARIYCSTAEEAGLPGCERIMGDLLYYGRLGRAEPAKAVRYYREAAERDDLTALVRLSDMYRSGNAVRRDPPESFRLLEKAYGLCTENSGRIRTDIYTRLARMRKADGEIGEAVRLYREAKELLKERIGERPAFRDLNTMEWLVDDLYTMCQPDPETMDLFDLYYVLQKPVTVSFRYGGKALYVSAAQEGENMTVLFEKEAYDSPGDFVTRAETDGKRLCGMWRQLSDFAIL